MTAGRTSGASLSQDWGTPPKYVAAAREALGGVIHLDPCSNAWSVVGARTSWRLPDTDGLSTAWDFPTVYVNPPYGADRARGARIGDWLRRCADAQADFGAEVVALIPVAPNTRHWKESVWARASSVCFLFDTRLKFLEHGRDTGKGAPMACSAVYWGARAERFAAAFAPHGAVLSLHDIRLPDLGHTRDARGAPGGVAVRREQVSPNAKNPRPLFPAEAGTQAFSEASQGPEKDLGPRFRGEERKNGRFKTGG